MPKDRHLAAASKGGKVASQRGTAHRFRTGTDEARHAARQGGVNVSKNRDHMREIGRRGGIAKGRRGR